MPEASARCATHPTVAAVGTCSRCGDYYCRACEDPHHQGVCVRCAERLPRGLAWEDRRAGNVLVRLAKTVVTLTLRPSQAFPGTARVGPALGFASLCGLAIGAMLVAMTVPVLSAGPGTLLGEIAARETGAFVAALALTLHLPAPLLLAWSWLSAASFAIGLKAVGRRHGALRFALRACAYSQVFLLIAMLVPFALAFSATFQPAEPALVRATGVAWIVASAAWPVLVGRHCRAAARGLGLRAWPAALAALGPTALAALVGAWVAALQLEALES